ncbi:MAG: exodeoxyribonuclease VII large subunit [Rickettsiaceae bacterium]|nr:exodeoxyribonuclease VII large subunit [Rickettsiaceae bacterium]MDP4832193.1 exodeoxyribonuclease VII large subunit [Rickettsiaceae bacterium]MDP5021227.1 exodeoxyribonuclease VII large subunit [Rickettsiaceae bacterium]MDP5083199.1 exodeoxyribonuclease VII large subunit [Rickettsiaceae bacterium]
MLEDNLTNNANSLVFSVSEISGKIKLLLENNLGVVKIKGEISGLKIASSGHGYFSLKDTNAILATTCWRHSLAKIQFKLEEGLEVVVTGRITAYAGQSKYQISADNIEPAGAGAFMQILKERKAKLEIEGLFAKEHKQQIPFLPKKIGIITSITGAVIKDIIHRISDRCPTHLIIWPVSVQGETAAGEITAAINGFNQLSLEHRPDLLIVARGGGSIEDLWPFNEEIVVRSVYNSVIPIISAVGHETDYTLIDLAADMRAPTPTAAAEFSVPVIVDLNYTIQSLQDRIASKLTNSLRYYSERLDANKRVLNQMLNQINNYTQRIDELSFRLVGALPNLLKNKQSSLRYFPITRLQPMKILKYKYLQYKHYGDNLISKKEPLLNAQEHRLVLSTSLLMSLDYNNVLKRGYAMLKNQGGHFISTVSDAKKSPSLYLKMQDGELLIDKTNT